MVAAIRTAEIDPGGEARGLRLPRFRLTGRPTAILDSEGARGATRLRIISRAASPDAGVDSSPLIATITRRRAERRFAPHEYRHPHGMPRQ